MNVRSDVRKKIDKETAKELFETALTNKLQEDIKRLVKGRLEGQSYDRICAAEERNKSTFSTNLGRACKILRVGRGDLVRLFTTSVLDPVLEAVRLPPLAGNAGREETSDKTGSAA